MHGVINESKSKTSAGRAYIYNLLKVVKRVQFTDTLNRIIEFDDGINSIMALMLSQTKIGKKIMFIGNGGSAAISSHAAVDYLKNGGMRAICFNDAPLLTCLSNDLGYEHVFEKAVDMVADPGDVLVAISSSGQSASIINGVSAGIKRGSNIITLSGFLESNPLRQMGDFNIYIPSDSYGFVELSHQIILHMLVDLQK